METKELKIEIPSGYIIDHAKSTFEKIVFKKKELTYEQICNELFINSKAWVIETGGKIVDMIVGKSRKQDSNNLTSKKQAEKILALIKLMNIATYLNDGWKPNWNDVCEKKYHIWIDAEDEDNKIEADYCCSTIYSPVYFKSEDLVQRAIQILGEDVIRTALSTDY